MLHESTAQESSPQGKLRNEIWLKEVETIWVLKRFSKEYVQSGEPWGELGIGEEIGTSGSYEEHLE